MKKVLYVIMGMIWVGVVFFKPLIKDINNVNTIKTTALHLILWPIGMALAAYNYLMKKELTAWVMKNEKDEGKSNT